MKKEDFGVAKFIILVCILSLGFKSPVSAADKVSMEDRVIGSTFKTLAKVFVATADIQKLKKNNIDKLNKMDQDKFQRRYARAYEALKDLPPGLKANYGITEDMNKEQAINDIETLDKKKIYAIIDTIPDEIIAKQFRQYLYHKKKEIAKSNLVVQINKLWNQMIEKANIPASPSNSR